MIKKLLQVLPIFIASSTAFAEAIIEDERALKIQNCTAYRTIMVTGQPSPGKSSTELIAETEAKAKILAERNGITHLANPQTSENPNTGEVLFSARAYKCNDPNFRSGSASAPSTDQRPSIEAKINQADRFVASGTVADANYADVASCQVLGDVVGEAILYWSPSHGIDKAKTEARQKAARAGATHIVWRAEKPGGTITVLGRGFNCAVSQQTTAPGVQDLLTVEYQRLLADAQQGKISYTNAFNQLNGTRSRLYPDNMYLAEYFRFLGEAAMRLDNKEWSYEQAEQFLEQRRQLIGQQAQLAYQQQINARVEQQLREDRSLQSQADATSQANANALLGLGLGVLMMNNFSQPTTPSAPVTCIWRSVPGGVQQICP